MTRSGWHRRKPQASTTARGYNGRHPRDRAAAIAAMPEGQPCYRCGNPMYSWQKLHYDHIIPVTYGGKDGPKALSHAACNLRHGARLGARIANANRNATAPFTTSRRW